MLPNDNNLIVLKTPRYFTCFHSTQARRDCLRQHFRVICILMTGRSMKSSFAIRPSFELAWEFAKLHK